MALLAQIFPDVTAQFQNDPRLRELLRNAIEQASDNSQFGLEQLAGLPAPGAQDGPPPQQGSPSPYGDVDAAAGVGPDRTTTIPKSPPMQVAPPVPANADAPSPAYAGQQANNAAKGPIIPNFDTSVESIVPPADNSGGAVGGPVSPPVASPAPVPQAAARPGAVDPRMVDAAVGRLPQPSKLAAFLAGLGSSNAILPAIGGGMQNVENLDASMAARNQTLRALLNRGVEPDTALAAVANPDLMKQVLASVFGKGTHFGEIRRDDFGNPVMGWIDDANRKTFNQDGSEVGAGGPGSGGTPASGEGLTGEAYLKTLPAGISAQLRKYASGELPLPQGFALSKPYFQRLMQQLTQYDPSFDAVNYQTRFATRKKFTSGKNADNITYFNTAMQHVGELEKSIDELNNGAYPDINKLRNTVGPRLGYTDIAGNTKAWNAAKTAVTDELTKAFRGTGGSVHDVEEWEKTLDVNDSPEAQRKVVRKALDLLKGRITSLGDEYDRGMGTTNDPLMLLSPKSREEFARITGEEVPSGPSIVKIKPGKGNPAFFEAGRGALGPNQEEGAGPGAVTEPGKGAVKTPPPTPPAQGGQTNAPAAGGVPNMNPSGLTPHDFGEQLPGMQQLQDGRWIVQDPNSKTGWKLWTPPTRR